MKTTKIIRDKKEVMKKLLTTMYESACAEKELLEMLLEEFEEEKSSQVQVKDEPRELIKGINGLAEFLGCCSTKAQNIMQDCWRRNLRYSIEFALKQHDYLVVNIRLRRHVVVQCLKFL